ncbi:MAG: hypothetical protein HC908_04710 [Calothrix sp. SM1_7_51]|nr:hypothetical protein [Calothrix sp. SM1_7_51]
MNQPHNPNHSGFPNTANAENQEESNLPVPGQTNLTELNKSRSHIHTQQISHIYQNQRQKLLFTLTAVLTGATLVIGVLVYVALKGFDTSTPTQQTSIVQNDTSTEAPIETSAPPVETQIPPQETVAIEPSTQTQNRQTSQSQKIPTSKKI